MYTVTPRIGAQWPKKMFTDCPLSKRWQAPGAVKKRKKNPKKIRKKIKKIVPVPKYDFVNWEQKAEFKANIKPCSHQLIVWNFYCSFINDILEGCKNFK